MYNWSIEMLLLQNDGQTTFKKQDEKLNYRSLLIALHNGKLYVTSIEYYTVIQTYYMKLILK